MRSYVPVHLRSPCLCDVTLGGSVHLLPILWYSNPVAEQKGAQRVYPGVHMRKTHATLTLQQELNNVWQCHTPLWFGKRLNTRGYTDDGTVPVDPLCIDRVQSSLKHTPAHALIRRGCVTCRQRPEQLMPHLGFELGWEQERPALILAPVGRENSHQTHTQSLNKRPQCVSPQPPPTQR